MANAILIIHFMYALFILTGFVYIWVGYIAGWESMRNRIFRYAHLAAMGIVVAESLFGIEADAAVTALVIASNDEKNWSQGVDVEWLGQRMAEKDERSIKDFMYGMNNVFKRLLLYPVPVIAAINGHAFGNGAILSCACDFRFMRGDKGFFCFPEVDLGIPFLPGMIEFVKKSVPYYKYNELKLTGRRAGAPELEEHHIIMKSCNGIDELMNESITFAKTFQKKRGIFREHKKRLHTYIISVMENEDPKYIEPLFLLVQD